VRWVRALLLGLLLGGLVVVQQVLVQCEGIDRSLAILHQERPDSSVKVLDRHGDTIDRLYTVRRHWVELDELPHSVVDALVAAEDSRFWEHQGVDVLGIVRAAWANFRAGHVVSGGSTITQQLVKNLVVGDERSLERKIREAILANRVEQVLSKEQILELYLNFVFLGSGNYGVEAAAQDYFGKSVRYVDAGQAALLVGLIPAPSLWSPRTDLTAATARRDLVLGRMVDEGFLTPEEAAGLRTRPVELPERRFGTGGRIAYLTEVRRTLQDALGTGIALGSGAVVQTAFDPQIQQLVDEARALAVDGVHARAGHRHPPEAPEGFKAALGPDGCGVGLVEGRAVVIDAAYPLSDAALASPMLQDDPEEKASTVARQIDDGDLLAVCVVDGIAELPAPDWARSSIVVIDNASGAVVAVSGDEDMSLEGFVRATQSRRQPGSSFKPYVYAAALSEGRRATDRIYDGRLAIRAPNGRMWRPKNYTGRYYGWLKVRDALARSLNTVAVRLAQEASPDDVVRTARALGIRSPLRVQLPIALGASEVTPLEQAAAYSAIARGGTAIEPHFVTEIVGPEGDSWGQAGEVLKVHDMPLGLLPGMPNDAVDPGVAYELLDMMRGVVERGTARRARRRGQDRFGKTGTTNGFADAWFVGAIPDYTIAVWVGAEHRLSMGYGETGGRAALPAWTHIADQLGSDGQRFAVPDGARFVRLSGEWVAAPRGVSRTPRTGSLRGVPPLPRFPGIGR